MTRMTRMTRPWAALTRTRARAIAFTAFIGMIWLNQSIGGNEWEALRDRTAAAPGEQSLLERVRYPFLFLYRRSGDEAIYYETASATFGRPYDTTVFAQRGDSPLPPVSTPLDGRFHVPYAEVPFEYPPPNVPFVLLPRLVTGSFRSYAYVFGAVMAALLLAAAVIGARLGVRGGTRRRERDERDERDEGDEAERIAAFGLLMLAHGAIAVQRLDAIVALLAILMVRAAVRRDASWLGLWGGLIGASKLVPILLVPVLVLASGIRDARRLGLVALGATVGVVVGLGPMIVLGRESLPLLLSYHSARGLHVESSLGVVYGACKAIAGMREASTMDYGSFNFHGAVSARLAKAGLAVTAGLMGVVAFAAWRGSAPGTGTGTGTGTGERERESERESARARRVVVAGLAGMGALWLGGKVFSPQYLTWALPLVIALPGPSWKRAALGLGVVLVLSQVYLRGYYDHVYNQWPAGVLTMTLRLAVLVALFVVALRALASRAAGPIRLDR